MVDDSDQTQDAAPRGNNRIAVALFSLWQKLLARMKPCFSRWGEEESVGIDDDSRIVRANLLSLQIEDRFEHFWIEERAQEIEEDNDSESVEGDELFSELLAAEEEWARLQQIRDQFRKNND
ncbi:hypothetical protein [Endozoicomonas numazuensis]|uniref:Uncharacterized protein n=1 Tax=Endozoicomonas numazuensis TaxID=1137799 RepID=A0A081N107_9GAMM|nr:hypothetical protein [Endozoicomonas numazuensis]KEQ12130.1 hypothetical protein GZ78_28260 [Endozoicomonas numazuensis]